MAWHRGGCGNFAENREKTSEAGKKGEHSHSGGRKDE
ncbi:stress-induced protein [Pantoea alhagi]|uniref:Stress-induced protein n=1 Tax=Pantoea alhagi TaxID=1891675 RepID=A0A1W6B8M0_9GAMM|nr:stress-induced protein [Pantoea alhagi]